MLNKEATLTDNNEPIEREKAHAQMIKENTIRIGSSMLALVLVYAIAEYQFGGTRLADILQALAFLPIIVNTVKFAYEYYKSKEKI